MKHLCIVPALLATLPLRAEEPPLTAEEFARKAAELREKAIQSIEPRVEVLTEAGSKPAGVFRWRTGIVTTVFFVGNSKGSQRASAWDAEWAKHFGGTDTPESKKRISGPSDYRPTAFIPKLNPFYCALPFNDVDHGTTKPESRTAIPWFSRTFVREGQSVCRDRWLAIRNPRNARIAYAQWSDAGPFRTDHFNYVFGSERPLPNANGGAGLNVSPSVRDYLGISSTDANDWRFVEVREVPPGPWRKYGENNPFATVPHGSTVAPAHQPPGKVKAE
jgi:hypothetical protein